MKKFLITTLTAVALVFTTSSFAADANKVNARTLYNFSTEFTNATEVTWVAKPEFSKAIFKMDNIEYNAFYDVHGDMIGTSHAIAIDNLPTSAKRVFAKRYSDYTVKEAIQFDTLDDTSYYISAENDQQSVILKVSDGILTVYRKTDKK